MFTFCKILLGMKLYIADTDITSYNEVIKFQGYEEIKRKKSLIKGYSYVFYEKKMDVNPIYEQYKFKNAVPTIYMIICLAIAFILATTFLILNFTLPNFDKLLYFFILMLPAFLFLLVGTLFSLFKYFNNIHNLDTLSKIMLAKKEEISNEHSK